MNKVKALLLVLSLLVILNTLGVVAAQDKQFEGVTIDILTFTGPQVAEPLQRRAPDFAEMTGATVNIVTVPNSALYQTMLTDAATGTNSYEGYVFAPQWIVDFAVPGYLEDLTPYVDADPAIEWDDVAPFFRNFSATFNGSIYSIPLDGDFHMVYYRSDIFEENNIEPPKTWDDYLAAAEALNGKDMNGDGEPDYGSCISKQRAQQAYWWIISIAAPFIQSQGTGQGAFFNTENMEPLVNNPGFIRALEIYKETNNYGPPDELNIGVGDTRALFTAGRCALTLDWGDIGSLAVDPENSVVQDKVGSIITPGSTQVLDWATNELVDCDETTCPYAIDGVNYAPFASFGGWSGGVNAGASQEQKDATYAFLSYMAQPAQANVDVTIGASGFNPYRISQFENLDNWTSHGFSEAAAEDYLGAIQASLNSPNMVLDIRVPQNQRYEQVILDEVLSRYLAGELTAEEAAQEISDRWNEVTDELGRDAQLEAYRGTLGIETGS
jgi:multiple sugar transport system substrate-binding protein